MDAQAAALRDEVRTRLHAVRDELHAQRDRLTEILAACQTTTSTLRQSMPEMGGPRLFARDVVRLGSAEILVARQAIRHSGGTHRLTPTEWQMLTYLLGHPGVVHSRIELAAGAWGAGFAQRNSEVEVYVSRLRRKLGPSGRLLETVRGRGYRLVLENRVTLRGVAEGMSAAGRSGVEGLALAPEGLPA